MPISEKGEGDVVVRLLIFSGREDPEWPLEPEQARDLAGRLGDVWDGEAVRPPEPAGLGYRGFLLRGLRSVGGPADVVLVYSGTVSPGERVEAESWRDRAGLEAWLLSQARDRGHAEALDAMGVEEASS
jgi:hypothetical protein